jgi:hypothetical protein
MKDEDFKQLLKRVENLEKLISEKIINENISREHLLQGEDIFPINFTYYSSDTVEYLILPLTSDFKKEFEDIYLISCNALFALLAPHMIREATEDNLHSIINEHILNNPSNYKNHKERERSIGNKLVKTVRMDWSSLTKIIIQFKALNLIEQSKNKRSVTDDNTALVQPD